MASNDDLIVTRRPAQVIIAVFLALLSVGFVFFVLKARSSSNNSTALEKFCVEALPFEGVFLESDVQREDFCAEHFRQYRLTNHSNIQVECMIDSSSCGCIGLTKDDTPLQVKQPWNMKPGDTVVVEMKLHIPAVGVSRDRAINLVVRDAANPLIAKHELLKERLAVYRDIEVHPSAVQLLFKRRGSDPAHFDFQVQTRIHKEHATDSIASIQASPALADAVELKVTPLETPEMLSPKLIQQDYLVTVSAKQSNAHLLTKHSDEVANFICISLPNRSSARKGERRCEFRVPVTTVDESELNSVRSIPLGQLVRGTPVTRGSLSAPMTVVSSAYPRTKS